MSLSGMSGTYLACCGAVRYQPTRCPVLRCGMAIGAAQGGSGPVAIARDNACVSRATPHALS
eukprot:396293-Rhodomonas_salina.1